MPYPELLLRRQCLRILTGSTLAVITGTVGPNRSNGAFQISVPAGAKPQEGKPAADWPQFLGPQRDGRSSEKIQVRDWSNGNLKLLWQFQLGEGYAIGSLSRNRFYQPHAQRGRETLACLDAETGELVWQESRISDYQDMYQYDSGPRCSPLVAESSVIQYGVDGVITARSLEDGSLLWERNLSQDYGVVQNFFGVGSSPIIFQDKLLVMVGGSPESDQDLPKGAIDRVTSNGSAIVALQLKDGSEVFQCGQELASYSSPVIHQFGDHMVLLAFCRGGLLGIDPENGKQLFQYAHRSRKLESVNAATPIVRDNQILLSETYGVGCVLLEVDPKNWTLKEVWKDIPNDREQSLQAHWNTPILIDDYLYASSGRHSANAELRCVAWETGEIQWSKKGLSRCSLTAASNELVVLSERGQLFLIEANPKQYVEITRHSFAPGVPAMRYPGWAAPIVAGGKIIARDANRLYCFAASDR